MHKHKTIVPQNKENKNIFVDSTKKSSEAVFRISSLFAKHEPHRRDEAQKYRLVDSDQRSAKTENKKTAAMTGTKNLRNRFRIALRQKKFAGDF